MEKLVDVLSELDDDTLVYIGSQSSYFDIVCTKQLKDSKYLNKLSESLHDAALKSIESAEYAVKKTMNNPPKFKDIAKKDDTHENAAIYLKTISDYSKRIEREITSLREAEQKERDFIPLCKREVKDVYPRIDGTGICVVVTGGEVGKYWFAEEKSIKT